MRSKHIDKNNYPPASEASRGVYWNQAKKNFTHPHTEYPWVSVTLSLCAQFWAVWQQPVFTNGPYCHSSRCSFLCNFSWYKAEKFLWIPLDNALCHENFPVQTHTICREALKFATQILAISFSVKIGDLYILLLTLFFHCIFLYKLGPL